MNLYRVIQKPIVTEKTTLVWWNKNVYVVEVDKASTKIDIKNSFREIYGVDVEKVWITIAREKYKNTRKWMTIKRRSTKKAYVTLKSDTKISFSIIK